MLTMNPGISAGRAHPAVPGLRAERAGPLRDGRPAPSGRGAERRGDLRDRAQARVVRDPTRSRSGRGRPSLEPFIGVLPFHPQAS